MIKTFNLTSTTTTLVATRIAAFTAAMLAFAAPSFAGVVYNWYPVSGNFGGYSIAVRTTSAPFIVAAGTTLTGVNFGVWTNLGGTVASVDWSIGTTPFGSEVGSGNATTSNTYLSTWPGWWDISSASLSLPDLSVGAGTYWLSLHNAVESGNCCEVFWDTALVGPWALESVQGWVATPTFQILDAAGDTVPEPTSFALLGSGLFGGILVRYRIVPRKRRFQGSKWHDSGRPDSGLLAIAFRGRCNHYNWPSTPQEYPAHSDPVTDRLAIDTALLRSGARR